MVVPGEMNTLAQRLVGKKFVIKRALLKLVGAELYIYDDKEQLLLLVNQKGFKLKEEINVFTDQTKTVCVMQIRARQVMDISGTYDVYDPATQTRIAVLQRRGFKSIVRDEWDIKDANEMPIAGCIEDSMLMALLRRFLSNLIPQNYDILVNGQRVVDLRQNFNPFSYHLVVTVEGMFDSRIAIAQAIMLALIEGRQSG